MIKPLVLSVVSALSSAGALHAQTKPEARFVAMTPAEVRAFENKVAEKIADLALVPPKLNTGPLPKYDYDQIDYGMTIGIARTPGGRIGACWVTGEDGPKAFFVLNRSDDDGETWSKPCLVIDAHDPNRIPTPRSTPPNLPGVPRFGKLRADSFQALEKHGTQTSNTWN